MEPIHMPKIAITALLVVGTAVAALAADHYASSTGSATWEQSLDVSTPCSLPTANAHVQPGDAVYLLGGTYRTAIAPARSGTPGDGRITYANYSEDQVVIRDAEHAIHLDKRSYVSVRGIQAYRCQQFLVILEGHHNDIGQCRFEQNRNESVWGGSWVQKSSTYNRIHDCVFTRFGWVADGDDKGILLDVGLDISTTDASDRNVIENNLFSYGGHHILHICGANNVVRGNYFHNEDWMDCDRPDGCGNRNAMTIGPMARQNLFEENRFAFAGTPPDDNGANGLVLRSPDNIVRRNMSYGNGAAGISLASMTVSIPTGNRIYANTIHHNGYDSAIDSLWWGGISFGNWGNGTMPGNVLVNNILHDNRHDRSISGYGEAGEQIIRTNWMDAGDPGFAAPSLPADTDDANLPDYRLRANSPCIDRGEFLTRITSESGSGIGFAVEDAEFFYDGWGVPGEVGDLIQLEGTTRVARILRIDYERDLIATDRELSWTTGQGVSLAYAGDAPDLGAHEYRGPYSQTEPILFRETFDDLPNGDLLPESWWVEGGQRVWIENGRLHVRANPKPDDETESKVCTVWLDREFSGDIRVEFDAHVIASQRQVNNINFFFMYSDPTGRPLRESLTDRADASYRSYHDLNGYIVTFLQDVSNIEQRWPDGMPKGRFRMRRCPGFNLIDETFDYHCRQGVTYRVAMIRQGTHLSYAVDGVVYAEAEDSNPLERGIIGLRTFGTELWWDNITVTALE
jgi:hypothetical protein